MAQSKRVIGNRYWSTDDGMQRLRTWKHLVGANVLVGEQTVDKLVEVAKKEYADRKVRLEASTHCWDPSCVYHLKDAGCEKVADPHAFCKGHGCSDSSHYYKSRRASLVDVMMSGDSSSASKGPDLGGAVDTVAPVDPYVSSFYDSARALFLAPKGGQREAYARVLKSYPNIESAVALGAVAKIPELQSHLSAYIEAFYECRSARYSATKNPDVGRANRTFASLVASVLSAHVPARVEKSIDILRLFTPKARVELLKQMKLQQDELESAFEYTHNNGIDPVPILKSLRRAGYRDGSLLHSLKAYNQSKVHDIWDSYKAR